jgi:hypothetical protein
VSIEKYRSQYQNPGCCSEREFEFWLEGVLGHGSAPDVRAGMCDDCLPEYRAKKVRAGQCTRGNEIGFRIDRDGFVHGYFKATKRKNNPVTEETITAARGLRALGLTLTDIASRLGRSRSSLTHHREEILNG